MNKSGCFFAVVCFVALTHRSIEAQTYVQTSPPTNQTVNQPTGTSLSVNLLTVPASGSITLGTTPPAYVFRDASGINMGALNLDPTSAGWISTNTGTLALNDDGGAGHHATIDMDTGGMRLRSGNDGGIVFDVTSGNGDLMAYIGNGMNFYVEDLDAAAGHYPIIFVADTRNDYVGISAYNPYDLLDVSNRETFGDGYMHWFADRAVVTLNSAGIVAAGWNTGISNPSNGVLSFDSTSDHDGKAAIKVGTITLAPVSSGTSGSITFPDGTVQGTAWNGTTFGGDYAESVDVMGDKATYEPGDVIVIDDSETGKFDKSTKPYSKMVAGVYSTKPGLVGRRLTADRLDKDAEVPMAMMGIVPTKVSADNGPIERGDLLVSSSKPGFAMKGTDRDRLTGAIIGKALAPLKFGSGVIEVLLALQ